jgi:hypothetical protein
MKQLIWTFVTLCLIANTAAGQILTARSGEHDGFTRVVFTIPNGTGWQLDQSGMAARLSVAIPDVQFDTEQVFKRISKTRLVDLRQNIPGGALELILGCDCAVSGFIEAETLLVLDIMDKSPRTAVDFGRSDLFAVEPYRFRNFSESTRGLKPELPARLMLPPKRSEPVESETSTPPALGMKTASEQRLIGAIRRASGQGLLTLKTTINGADAVQNENGPTPPTSELKSENDRAIGVLATTAIEESANVQVASRSELANPDACLDSALVDVASWTNAQPFQAQIGELRTNLFGEFDQLNLEAVDALAKTYIHFGFGAEAIQTLKLAPAVGEHQIILNALAQLIESGTLDEKAPFSGQQGCDSRVALWALLANGIEFDGINDRAVLEAFAELPGHLRTRIGPILSQRLVEAKDIETAAAILRFSDRADADADDALPFAQAAISAARGNSGQAVVQLETIVRSGSDSSTAALIELVEKSWQTGTPVSPEIPDLIAAHVFEYRNSELGPKLRLAHATALGLADRFVEAFGSTDHFSLPEEDSDRRNALVRIFNLLTANADDLTFLMFASSSDWTLSVQLPGSLMNDMSGRLLDLGFSDAASLLLTNATEDSAPQDRRILRARAALEQGRPHLALVEVLGIQDARSNSIRGEALARQRDHGKAGEFFLKAGQEIDALRHLWLSGDAPLSSSAPDSPYRETDKITRALLDPAEVNGELGPLSDAVVLLEQSAKTRDMIDQLFASVSKKPTETPR